MVKAIDKKDIQKIIEYEELLKSKLEKLKNINWKKAVLEIN